MSFIAPLAPEHLFDKLAGFDAIAVAVSGGSDSLALLYLLHSWALSTGKRLSVLTVDHQLRDASRDEAAYVGSLCNRLDVQHHILTWHGEKPAAGLSSAARRVRYDLMAAHCAAHDIQVLALGHTRDDQAETTLMRLQRTQAENRGLSGMAETTLFAPDPRSSVMLYRPLLSVSRAELRAYLSSRDVAWVDDPTNEDHRYERVRVREQLAREPKQAQRLIDYAAVHARYRRHMASDVARFIDLHCSLSPLDCVLVERSKLDEQPLALAVLVLQVLLSVVGGRDHLPSSIKVLGALKKAFPSTLARVHMNQNKTHLILFREDRNLPSKIELESKPLLWDQRLWLTRNDAMADGIEILSGHDLDDNDQGCDVLYDIHSHDDEMFLQIKKFEKTALGSMPFGRICDKDNFQTAFALRSKIASKTLTLSWAYGAFDRYCTDFDFSIRQALERLFTVKTLNK